MTVAAPATHDYRRPGEPRYEVWPIERKRSPHRFQVVDLAQAARIVVRCVDKEIAESFAKQLNEKGFIETL